MLAASEDQPSVRAFKVAARITEDHSLHIQLPEDVGEGIAEVIVLVPDSAEQAQPRPTGETLDDFLRSPRVDPRFTRSKQEIDDYLRAERESWH